MSETFNFHFLRTCGSYTPDSPCVPAVEGYLFAVPAGVEVRQESAHLEKIEKSDEEMFCRRSAEVLCIVEVMSVLLIAFAFGVDRNSSCCFSICGKWATFVCFKVSNLY